MSILDLAVAIHAVTDVALLLFLIHIWRNRHHGL